MGCDDMNLNGVMADEATMLIIRNIIFGDNEFEDSYRLFSMIENPYAEMLPADFYGDEDAREKLEEEAQAEVNASGDCIAFSNWANIQTPPDIVQYAFLENEARAVVDGFIEPGFGAHFGRVDEKEDVVSDVMAARLGESLTHRERQNAEILEKVEITTLAAQVRNYVKYLGDILPVERLDNPKFTGEGKALCDLMLPTAPVAVDK
eukprot:NODE_1070_length_681_cov_345.213608_g836_i0.p1 GENE.NODE_1070_length_681_cov_345.213608_g836_i0~~NODE_1070_length_681_cov_345.213608_g836_i0.p1  ORF type:complete len:214 (-),score=53.94 NODE_1070_length_681_cov_345.213608_g836_i0:40-657(-)